MKQFLKNLVMWPLMILVAILVFMGAIFAQDTYCFQVDIASFTQKELDGFQNLGSKNDPEIFRQTYLLPNTSYFYTLKITPKDDKERDQLLSFVGAGFDVLGIYNKTGILTVKADNTDKFTNVKPVPALPPKAEKP